MSKKLREGDPIFIAPDITGELCNGNPLVTDKKNNKNLNPRNVHDKIKIYERQVKGWFLDPATKLIKSKNTEFIVLMICLSYLEGVEQYREGRESNRNSREFFCSAMERIYPNINEYELRDFYSEARCGLFHNGMVKGRIITNNNFDESIKFSRNDIEVNPSKFLKDIKQDFKNYLEELKTDDTLRNRFDNMYSNL